MIKRRKEPRRKAPWVTMGGRVEPEKKRAKRIRPISRKQSARLTEYSRLRVVWLFNRVRCDRCGGRPGCRIEVHHKRGRAGALLLATEHWAALCPSCHRWVHDNPADARETGWLGPWGKRH